MIQGSLEQHTSTVVSVAWTVKYEAQNNRIPPRYEYVVFVEVNTRWSGEIDVPYRTTYCLHCYYYSSPLKRYLGIVCSLYDCYVPYHVSYECVKSSNGQ